MKTNIMRRLYLLSIIIVVVLSASFFSTGESQPRFYMATDKSFGSDEIPYINLEGPGNVSYEFRVYKIDDPVSFIKGSVKERLVKEKNDNAYGNSIAIFRQTVQNFKNDFRAIARKEFNYKTRSYIKQSAGVDYDKPDEKINPAIVGLLKDHKLLFSFSVPGGDNNWTYRRIPVPVSENGMYLIEGVNGSNVGHTLVVKSNINFVTKQSDEQTLIYAASRNSGSPIPSANVILLDGKTGADIIRGVTSREGVLELDRQSLEKSLIIINKDNEYAISDPNFYAKSFYGSGGFRMYVYTERPIYKPGNDVSFKGIVRRFQGDRYSLAAGTGVASVVNVGGKTVIDNIPVTITGEAGTFEGSFTLPGGDNIQLGVYNLVVVYNGESFSTEFSVEAYKKPEFLVKVNTPKRIYIGSETIPVTVAARYYYGEPLKGGELNYKVFRSKKFDYSPVGQIPYFVIDADYLGIDSFNKKRELVVEKKASLDNEGTFSFKIEPEDIDDDYTYSVIASVEALNSTISGSTSFSVNRSEFFIRIIKDSSVYSPGDSISFEAQLVPFDTTIEKGKRGKLISNKKITAELYTRSFKYISAEAGRDKLESKSTATDNNGTAKFSFNIEKGGHYIVKCRAEDSEGEETTAETAFWASNKSDSIQVPFKNISLKSKKDIYMVGDEAQVLIMSPVADGTIFITLESNKILKHNVISMKGNTQKYSFPINEGMSPNCTVSVLQFSGNQIYQNQIKIVAPPVHKFINVDLKPEKEIYKPGEAASVIVETTGLNKKGVRSEVSIAVVDEAIYQLQEDKNPPITTYFYHPRRNNVNTTLSAAYRFFGYSEAQRLKLALAKKDNGPLAAIKDDEKSRENYKDTCYWTARVMTDSSGRARVTFPLADNITTWRVTAIAVSSDTKVGQAKTSFIARKELMMTSALPSFIIKGEKQTVAAHVSNLTKDKIDAVISIKGENVTIEGKQSESVQIEPGGMKQVYFNVSAPKDTDNDDCVIDMKVKGGKYSDGARRSVPLKPFGIERSIASSIKIVDNDEREITLDLPDSYIDQKLEVRLSPGFGEALRHSLKYLVDYPYGCVEQTMSRFMPLLAARKAGYIDPVVAHQLPQMVSQGLSALSSHQKSDGGFGWYGDPRSNALMTAYVYRGLAICKTLYGQTDSKMMTEARSFLYRYIKRNDPDNFERAYILAALSEGGKVEKSMVDKLYATASSQSVYGKALTAFVLVNNGMNVMAEEIFSKALNESGLKGKDAVLFDEKETVWERDYVETTATLLSTAVRLNKSNDLVNDLSSLLVLNRRGVAWKNSRDTSMAVLALSEELQYMRDRGGSSKVTIELNGGEPREFRVSSDKVEENQSLVTYSADVVTRKNVLKIKKERGVPLYIMAIASFTDQSTSFKKTAQGFDVERTYYRMKGDKSLSGKYSFKATSTSEFNHGDLVMVELKVKFDDNNYTYVMVNDPVIPGFSVVRNDAEYYSDEYKKEYTTLQAFEDHTALFIPNTYERLGSCVIRYFVRANLPGTYRVVPASCKLMYYPQVSGTSSDVTITVK